MSATSVPYSILSRFPTVPLHLKNKYVCLAKPVGERHAKMTTVEQMEQPFLSQHVSRSQRQTHGLVDRPWPREAGIANLARFYRRTLSEKKDGDLLLTKECPSVRCSRGDSKKLAISPSLDSWLVPTLLYESRSKRRVYFDAQGADGDTVLQNTRRHSAPNKRLMSLPNLAVVPIVVRDSLHPIPRMALTQHRG